MGAMCPNIIPRGTVVILCVSLSVYLSVTMLAAIWLVYTLKGRCHRILYGVFKVLVVHVTFIENTLFKSSGIIC